MTTIEIYEQSTKHKEHRRNKRTQIHKIKETYRKANDTSNDQSTKNQRKSYENTGNQLEHP